MHVRTSEMIAGIFLGGILKGKISKSVYKEHKPLEYCMLNE